MINLLPVPTEQQEISIMLELGFMIDNYLIKRAVRLSNDYILEEEILAHLSAVATSTLQRAQLLQKGDGCF